MPTNYPDLIPRDVAREVVTTIADRESAVMQLAHTIQMPSGVEVVPVVTAAPASGFVSPDFRRFCELIEAEGYRARFEGIAYRYLRVDDHLYWASRSLWAPGQNLNRRPASDVEGDPAHEQTRLPLEC